MDARTHRRRTIHEQVGVPYAMRALPVVLMVVLWVAPARVSDPGRGGSPRVLATVLAYHRFGVAATDAMTVRTSTLRAQLTYLEHHGYAVVPLRTVVRAMRGQETALPPRPVAITVDDGHRSVFTELLPLAEEYDVPVTLFVYPSAVSNAPYALTWDQLRALKATGRFDVQSHTYWHPNFHHERRRLSPEAYERFVGFQLNRPRDVIARQLGTDPDLLAWPFGIYDEQLVRLASASGYVAALTLDHRPVTSADNLMTLPRYLVTDGAVGARFAAMLPGELP
jgi:peptidoglycan/xylan/chitin deacetylase (PgdA/CDA1 family)